MSEHYWTNILIQCPRIIVTQIAALKWLNKWCLEIYLYMLKIWVETLQTMEFLN
jgi:hypothetical protein